jgi:hypothetical protein
MYVANCTKQNKELGYRMIEHPAGSPARYFKIAAGAQEVFPKDLSTEDIDYLVKQFKCVKYDEIDRTKGFVGVAYRIDKEISASQIQRGIFHNDEAAVARSEKVFEESGVALAAVLEKRAQEEGGNLVKTEVSVQQDFDGSPPKNAVAKGVKVERAA